MRDTKWGKRARVFFYYAFLILTVGAFLLFIPLHGIKKSDSNPSSEVTQRETNATGERILYQVSPSSELVFGPGNWIEDFKIQNPEDI